jgi:prolipoprotein diacylglyceryltransferase
MDAGHLWHLGFEALAYCVGGQLYWRARRAQPQPAEVPDRLAIAAGAVFGAAVGAKLLAFATYAEALLAQPWPAWLAGKTIVGAILGGIAGVEGAKALIGWRPSTGDAFVMPLLAGIAIGRLGCHFAGIEDHTFGNPTGLPWGMDLGDGIARHPTALYEALFLLALAPALYALPLPQPVNGGGGERFRLFLCAYLAWRFGVDFLKPPHGDYPSPAGVVAATSWAGLSAIQWAALATIAGYAPGLARRAWRRRLATPG